MVTSASTGLSAVQVTAIVLGYLSMIPFAISFQVNKRKFNILMLAIGCLITAASCICECIARNDLVVFLTPAVIFAMLPLAYIVLYFKPTKDWATFRFWPLILCGLVGVATVAIFFLVPKQDNYRALFVAFSAFASIIAFWCKSDKFMHNFHLATSLMSLFFFFIAKSELWYGFLLLLVSVIVAKLRFDKKGIND